MIKYYSDSTVYFHHMYDKEPDPDCFTMHNHSFYEIFYLISGKGSFFVECNEYVLHSGDVIIIRGEEAHYISISKNIPYERIALLFDSNIISPADSENVLLKAFEMRELGERNHLTPTKFKDKTYTILFNNILSLSELNPRTQIISNLFALLNEIMIAYENTDENGIKKSDTLERNVVTYINNRIKEPISLDEICKHFFISKSQLGRIFKRTMNTTVYEYITVKRLTSARNMILSGMLPTQVFSECGFADYSTFYRAYRKHYGCSPSNDSNENLTQNFF